MKKLSFYSLFSGGGGSDCGAVAAGLRPIGGVELDPYPAALYEANFGHPLREENILDTPTYELPDMDFLWASPPCPSFSTAKTDGGETDNDIAVAGKVALILRAKFPRYFALENVRGYVGSESFRQICRTLDDWGYNIHYAIYDSANFGVPQNRNRLILRASRDRLCLLQPTHGKVPDLFHQPWNGWYDAVADLLPSCKPTHLTEKQIQSLEKKGWYGEVERRLAVSNEYLEQNGKAGRSDALPIGTVTTQSKPLAVMVDGKENSYGSSITTVHGSQPSHAVTATSFKGLRRAVLLDCKGNRYSSDYTMAESDSPSFGIRASSANQCRAVLLERVGYGKERDPTTRTAEEPSITLRAHTGCDERGGFRSPLTALLKHADIRALDYRCLARLQSFPDSYQWGSSAGKNCRTIGNAIPPLFAQRVIESIVGTKNNV
jgi:DNA (cytosine-5)-methyltransferase 1